MLPLALHLDLSCGDASLHLQRGCLSHWWLLRCSKGKFTWTIHIAAGSREQRLRLFTVVLLFWAALGFDLSWKQGQKGQTVEWIGLRIQFAQGMELQCNSQKRKPRLQRTASMKSFTATPCCQPRRLCLSLDTCRGSRQLRQWPEHLCRCFGEHSQITPSVRRRENTTRKRLEKLVFVKRIFHAVRWLRDFFVSAGSTSVNIHFECPNMCSKFSHSH